MDAAGRLLRAGGRLVPGGDEETHGWEVPRTGYLPSGYVKIAIENGHRNSGFTHLKW